MCAIFAVSCDLMKQGYDLHLPQIHFWQLNPKPLSSAEALVFLGFNITMRYISLHFTWRILEHERSRWAKEQPIKTSAEERDPKLWLLATVAILKQLGWNWIYAIVVPYNVISDMPTYIFSTHVPLFISRNACTVPLAWRLCLLW
jgi:hypothetical protein